MSAFTFRSLAISLLVVATSAAGEDRVSLEDGSVLRGTVRSIGADGEVVLDSPLASEAVSLRGDAVQSISFDMPFAEARGHSELLHLTNGDVLPGNVRALDAEGLTLQTWYAGTIRVGRRFARAVDFGVTPQKLVYQGPGDLSGWSDNEDWELEDGKLVCGTTGTIVRDGVLPQQFILRFRVEWENGPKFRIYFCDDHLERTGLADRYYFEINSKGSQLKRQTASGDRQWFTLAQSYRLPEEFARRGVDVEIRVDRVQRLLYLYLDGEKIQRTADSIDEFPTGTGVMLQSLASGELKNIVPRIEIYEWDAITELRRDEGHEDPSTDGIVDIEGQHFSGSARALVREGDEEWIVFESPFNPDPLKIRANRISSLYFKDSGESTEANTPLQVDLRGGGKLQLTSLALGDETLSAQHPLLGDLRLNREALQQLIVDAPDGEDLSDQ